MSQTCDPCGQTPMDELLAQLQKETSYQPPTATVLPPATPYLETINLPIGATVLFHGLGTTAIRVEIRHNGRDLYIAHQSTSPDHLTITSYHAYVGVFVAISPLALLLASSTGTSGVAVVDMGTYVTLTIP